MEADEVDPPAVAVMRVELGRVLVRERPELQKFGRPGAGAESAERIAGPAGAFALNRLLQRCIGIVKVSVDQLDRLVDHLVRHGAVRIKGRAEIILSVGKDVHGMRSPFSARLLLMSEIGKETPIPVALGRGAVLTPRPCPQPHSTAD